MEDDLLKGVAVSGDFIAGLADKSFTILKQPVYENIPDLNNPKEMVEKLKLFVELSDKSQLDYYPNKSSQKALANMFGYHMTAWIGQKAAWMVNPQIVMGQQKNVLFVISQKEFPTRN